MGEPDPFDDALADLRISGSVLLHESFTPDWAVDIPEQAQLRRMLRAADDTRVLTFHLVRRGGFDLSDAHGAIRVDVPELALVPGGQAHRLSVGRSARGMPLAELLTRGATTHDCPPSPRATEIVCGAFVVRAAPLNPLLGALPRMLKVPAGGETARPALCGVAALLTLELGHRSRDGFTAQRLLEVLCAEAIRAFQATGGEHRPGWFRGLADPKIAEALRGIHEAPAADWSVEALAGRVALSPSRFAARFRETCGESAMGYVASWRANVASRLLRDSDLPLAEIAERVGYRSLPAFSRAFKAKIGVPPAQWRRVP